MKNKPAGNKGSSLVLFVGRLFLGGIFAYAGFSKLMEPVENFRGIIAQYEVIPYMFVPVIALVFPWLELMFGIFLIIGYLPRISALALAIFSMIFLIVLSSSKVLLGSVPIACGCFGENGIHLTVRQVFLLDFIDMILGIKLAQSPSLILSLHEWLKKPLSAG